MSSPSPSSSPSSPRWLAAIESIALVALGVGLLTFYYHASTPRPGDEIGVPEFDSFYHIKMAAKLPEWGLLRELPWLEYVYFTREGREFVSHHFGFHVLLSPLVHLSKWLTGDDLHGARWTMALVFGLNLAAFNLLLRAGSVRWRWLWLLVFLLLPQQFFLRHTYIRAIGPSLLGMQVVLWALLTRRYLPAAVAIVAYIHVYLGSVLYVPVIVSAFVLGALIARQGEPRFASRMVLLAGAGWVTGVLTYPYLRGMLEFLRLQVLGSGLAPDIEVGQEWKPYTSLWFFASMSATLLSVWGAALVARALHGPWLSAREAALLLLQFAFLALTFKARRFIEYWPPLCLLSAAWIARPALATIEDRLRAYVARSRPPADRLLGPLGAAALCVTAAGSLTLALWRTSAPLVQAEYPLWLLLTLLVVLVPLVRAARLGAAGGATPGVLRTVVFVFAGAGIIVAGVLAAGWLSGRSAGLAPPRLPVPPWAWVALGVAYALTAALAARARPGEQPAAARPTRTAWLGLAPLLAVAGVALTGLMVCVRVGAVTHEQTARGARCNFDLAEVRRAMSFLVQHSEPGDLVFTDDWDIFPVYFYVNHHNRYIVGLDPKFTHERRPDLWERFVRITRAQAPTHSRVRFTRPDGSVREDVIDIDYVDIRDEFRARWVIIDSDHFSFAQQLASRPEHFEFAYPCRRFEECKGAAFFIFRVRPPDNGGPAGLPGREPARRGSVAEAGERALPNGRGATSYGCPVARWLRS